MKKIVFLLFLATFEHAMAAEVTFRDAVLRVFEQSVELQRAKLAESLAQTDASLTNLESDPKLSAQALYSFQYPRPTSPKDQTYSLTLSHTLYDFGRTGSKEKLAEAQVKVKTLTIQEVRDALYWETARRYQSLISALRISSSSTNSVKIAQDRMDTQQRYYRQGMRSESDLASAEADFRREQLVQARARDEVLFASLRLRALYDAANQTLEAVAVDIPTASLSSISETRAKEFLGKWNEPNLSATQKRIDAQLETFVLQKQSIDSSRWPIIGGTVGGQESGTWTEVKPSLSAQLQVSWAIPWNGVLGQEQHKLAVQQKDLDLQKQNDLKTRRDLDKLAVVQIERLSAQLQLLRERAKTLERVQELVRRRYEAGKSSALELTATTADLSNARLDEVRQANSIQSALIDLAQARSIQDIQSLFFQ